MTVVVAFLCSDGMVVAADSMLTPNLGNLQVGHHTGVKVYVLPGPQVFAFAGDQGQAGRFKVIAETNATSSAAASHPIQYPLTLSQILIAQLQSTGIATNSVDLNAILGFLQGGNCHCCVFERAMQPRNLDQNHYYVALGIGKLSADPFLRFLVDTFCQPGQPPKVHLAMFLAIWTVQHVINVNPGGVAGPIRAALFEKDNTGSIIANELSATAIDAHKQAIEDAAMALQNWRQGIQSEAAAIDVPEPPTAPTLEDAGRA